MSGWRVLEPRGFVQLPSGAIKRLMKPRRDLARNTATGCWRAVVLHVREKYLDECGLGHLQVRAEVPPAEQVDALRELGWVVQRMPGDLWPRGSALGLGGGEP